MLCVFNDWQRHHFGVVVLSVEWKDLGYHPDRRATTEQINSHQTAYTS